MKMRRSWDSEGKGDKLYGRRWRKARDAYLASNPLCAMCQRAGNVVAATVVDHVIPHRGNDEFFWSIENWQSLCEHHHNSEKAVIEARGFTDRIGVDGWPIDPAHPANGGVGGCDKLGAKVRTPPSQNEIDLVSAENDGKGGKNGAEPEKILGIG